MNKLRVHIYTAVFTLLTVTGLTYAQGPGPESVLQDQAAVMTAFTYQGRLTDGGDAANGPYDFEFKLYDDVDTDAQIGDTVTKGDVSVSDGLFTVALDFGSGVFVGEARYLEIGVRPGSSSGVYTILSPRQPITAAPFALALPGLYTLPNSFSANVVGGATSNLAWDSLVGATISGGGGEDIENRVTDRFGTIGGGARNLAGNESEDVTDAWFATVGGGWQNAATDVNATVAGGAENTASGVSSFVGGGFQNEASGLLHATVCGGEANQASGENNATVGGGNRNVASGYWNATIAGGANNVASGDESTVGGGAENTANGQYNATVSGGYRNTASGTDATVAGGNSNTAGNWAATVSGGYTNTVTAAAATVSGGASNRASGFAATVGGGQRNEGNADHSVVAGGYWNVTYGITSTISGGQQNFINRDYATIGGGHNNQVYADYGTIAGGGGQDDASANIVYDGGGTIAGGRANRAGTDNADPTDAADATVGGGRANVADGWAATVGGGDSNRAVGSGSTVGGGIGNLANISATISGGYSNMAYGYWSTIGGGRDNATDAYTDGATVGGGSSNWAANDFAVVGGGFSNEAAGESSFVGGGRNNDAHGDYATVAGGLGNRASGEGATVGGGGSIPSVIQGYPNVADGDHSTIAGGSGNTASGLFATVPGGAENLAQGDRSLAAGNRAKAYNDGCFVWGDSTSADVACAADDEFVVRASGGVYLYTSDDLSSGSYLGAGMSTWNPLPPPSDRDLKENVVPTDPQAVLQQIVSVPVSTWNYKSGDPAVRHMGPMAQDFYAAFGLGKDERHISTIDADGVALAAIQGLYALSEEQAARIDELEADNRGLQEQIGDLEGRVRALERGSGPARASLLPAARMLLAGITVVWAARRRGLRALVMGGDQ